MLKTERTGNKTRQFFKRRIIFFALALLVVTALFFTVRYFYIQYKYPSIPAIQSVPENAIAIIEATNLEMLKEELFSEDQITHILNNDSVAASVLSFLNDLSAKTQGNRQLEELCQSAKTFVSFVSTKDGHIEILISIEGGRGLSTKKLYSALQGIYPDINKKQILEIAYYATGGENPVLFTVHKGIILITFNREILELGYYTINSGRSVEKDEEFEEVYQYLNKSLNDQTRVYLSYAQIYKWWSTLLPEENRQLISTLADFGSWSALELNSGENGITLQGYTNYNKQEASFTGIFRGIDMTEAWSNALLPSNTIGFKREAIYPFNNYYHYYTKKFLSSRPGSEKQYPVAQSTTDSLAEIFAFYSQHELVTGLTDHIDTIAGSNYFLTIGCNDIEGMSRALLPFSDTNNHVAYQAFNITRLKQKYLIPALLGPRFHSFENGYYTFAGNYILITNNPSTLLSVLNNISLGNTMVGETKIQQLFSTIPEQNHLTFFFNFKSGYNWIHSITDNSQSERVAKAEPLMPEMIIASFSLEQDIMITDFVLDVGQTGHGEQKEKEVLLPDQPVISPVFINDHRSNDKKILVFCQNSTASLIRQSGEIVWQMNVEELPTSAIFEVDLFKNGKHQYLYLGKEKIHLLALNGEYVNGWPADLPSVNLGNVSLFNYENNSNYRIVYESRGNTIQNVTVKGENVTGWQNPVLESGLSKPLIHTVLNGSDYLVAIDSIGAPTFYNRRGEIKFIPKNQAIVSKNSQLTAINSDALKGFIFLNSEGNFTLVKEDGEIEEHELLHFSNNVSFVINHQPDGKSDLIFIGDGEMFIYNQNIQLTGRFENDLKLVKDIVIVPDKDKRWFLYGADIISNQPFVLLDNGRKITNSFWSREWYSFDRFSPQDDISLVFIKGKLLKILNKIE